MTLVASTRDEQVRQLESRVEELSRLNSDLDTALAAKDSASADASSQLDALRCEVQQLRSDCIAADKRQSEAKERLLAQEAENATLIDKSKAKSNLVVNLQRELENTEKKLKEYQNKLKEVQGEKTDFESRLLDISSSISAADSTAADELDELKLQLSKAMNEKASLQMELQTSKSELERTLSSDRSDEGSGGLFGWLGGSAKKRRPSSSSDLRRLASDLDSAKTELIQTKEKFDALEEKYKKERSLAKKLSETNMVLTEQKDNLQTKLDAMIKEAETLNEKVKTLVETRHKIAKDLKAERMKRMQLEGNLADNEKELHALRDTATGKSESGMLSELESALNETRKELFDLRARSSSCASSMSTAVEGGVEEGDIQRPSDEDLQDAYRRLAEAKTQLRVAEERAATLEVRTGELERKIATLEERNTSTRRELSRSSAEKMEHLIRQETSLEKKLGTARAEVIKARQRASDVEGKLTFEIKTLQKALFEEKKLRDDAERKLGVHDRELQRLRGRVRDLASKSPSQSLHPASASPTPSAGKGRETRRRSFSGSAAIPTPRVVKVDLGEKRQKSLSPSRIRQPSKASSKLRQPAARAKSPVKPRVPASTLTSSTPVARRTRSAARAMDTDRGDSTSSRRYNTRSSAAASKQKSAKSGSRLRAPGFASSRR